LLDERPLLGGLRLRVLAAELSTARERREKAAGAKIRSIVGTLKLITLVPTILECCSFR